MLPFASHSIAVRQSTWLSKAAKKRQVKALFLEDIVEKMQWGPPRLARPAGGGLRHHGESEVTSPSVCWILFFPKPSFSGGMMHIPTPRLSPFFKRYLGPRKLGSAARRAFARWTPPEKLGCPVSLVLLSLRVRSSPVGSESDSERDNGAVSVCRFRSMSQKRSPCARFRKKEGLLLCVVSGSHWLVGW